MRDERFDEWIRGLESRHLADLRFAEVARSVRALSASYVERRTGLGRGRPLDGTGKRAAFALYYAPLHFLLVRDIARELCGLPGRPASLIVDLGCGTGVAGAAWAADRQPPPKILGVDRHPWALGEAVHTYRAFGLSGRTRIGHAARVEIPRPPVSIVAAFVLNELEEASREDLLSKLLERASRGDSVLIVEPLAGFVAPWWKGWQARFEAAGGRADEWRFRPVLPEIVRKLDRAAGLRHDEVTGRSLWIPGVGDGVLRRTDDILGE